MQKILDRIPREWGKEMRCDEGWWPLISKLDDDIAAIDPNYIVLQCKEKFAGLRYYVELSEGLTDDQREQVDNLIREAEGKSTEICELCGKPGTINNNDGFRGWYRTLCPEHKRERAVNV